MTYFPDEKTLRKCFLDEFMPNAERYPVVETVVRLVTKKWANQKGSPEMCELYSLILGIDMKAGKDSYTGDSLGTGVSEKDAYTISKIVERVLKRSLLENASIMLD